MYLDGWAAGRSEGLFETLRVMDEKRWIKAVTEGVEKDPQLKSLPSKVTVGQLLEGVNKFFEDYRNLHVSVPNAVSLIYQEPAGRIILTDEYLQEIRRLEARRGHK
jgi:hypothetical protein